MSRIEDSVRPLRCVFAPEAPAARQLRFRLRDGIGRETAEFEVPVRSIPNEEALDTIVTGILRRVEREGFRHRR
ncbi:MAG TPA: hypothetical protein VD970_08880 [Acetobacteraceae bacterium]|nr:hypothetical protein [Acetobacteraceae bacterium]